MLVAGWKRFHVAFGKVGKNHGDTMAPGGELGIRVKTLKAVEMGRNREGSLSVS